MSHFTVAVIHHPRQDIDTMLYPFWEESLTDFMDKTDEIKESYETGYEIRWKTADGEIKKSEDSDFEIEISEEEYYNLPPDIPRFCDYSEKKARYLKYCPAEFGAVEIRIPYKEIYGSLEEYAEKYFGCIEENGRFGYWYNPDAKWDWYEVGGRWNGMLKLKPGRSGIQGSDGVFGRREKYADEETHCSEAVISDIDFSPDKDDYDAALRFWEIYVDKEPLKEGEEIPNAWYTEEWYKDRYADKFDYAKRISAFTTYAVLTPDGIWHEPGEMGWFGFSTATADDETEWDNNYMKFIEAASPTDVLTIVDCHI